MSDRRIHSAISPDGTEIAGRVHGEGPPLVLVHGGLEDGDLCWEALLPWLDDHFTCYLMSTRGRGLSGNSPDHSPQRLLEDVVSFVQSIGEPVFLFGESDGASSALGAAARTASVSAVAAYEPTVFEVADEELAARLGEALQQVEAAVDEGRLTEAARAFASVVANDEEMKLLNASGYLEACARYLPIQLREMEQGAHPEAVSPTDPLLLAAIEAPVLLMNGSRTALHTWFEAGVCRVAELAKNARTREIEGAGHFGVAYAPSPISEELKNFFQSHA